MDSDVLAASPSPSPLPAEARPGPVSDYRWFVVLAAWSAFLVSFVDRLAWANLAAPVGQALGLPLASLGAFVTAFYVGYVISNAINGVITDLLGPRIVLTMSVLLLGTATFAFGSVTSLWLGIALQVLMGFCAGADYAAGVKIITAWFTVTERGRAIGWWFTASSLGITVTNLIVPPIAQGIGWENTYRLLGTATVAIAALCFLVLRDGPSGQPAVPRPNVGALLRDRDIILIALAGFGALWGTWGFAFWATALMVRGHGMSASEAAGVVALFGFGAAVAKPLIGYLADWLGGARRGLVIGCLLAFAVLLVVFGTLSTRTEFLVAAPFLGVAAFVYSPLLAALVAEVAGRASAGSALGFTNALWQLGSVLVPLSVGAVYQATGSFLVAFTTLAAGPLLGFACMLAVRPRRDVV